MAYIKKENVIDIIDNSADLQEVKSCVFMMENADVIERCKIDNAVKEIKEFASAVERVTFLKKIRLEDVLEIIESNIGE